MLNYRNCPIRAADKDVDKILWPREYHLPQVQLYQKMRKERLDLRYRKAVEKARRTMHIAKRRHFCHAIFGFVIVGLICSIVIHWFSLELIPHMSTCPCELTKVTSAASPYLRLVCQNATMAARVSCMVKFFRINDDDWKTVHDLHVEIASSDLDMFDDSIFNKHAVVSSLRLSSCNLDTIPYQLTNLLTRRLRSFRIDNNALTWLLSEAFVHFSMLEILDLSANKIAMVSPKAFKGLANLQELHLQYNAIESLEPWEGLENLKHLDLSGNNIKKVSSQAFLGMTKLTTLKLAENQIKAIEEGTFDPIHPQAVTFAFNPFNCTCSMKWLQNWISANDVGKDASCASPESGILQDFTFCSQDPPKSASWTNMLQLGSILGILLITLYAAINSGIVQALPGLLPRNPKFIERIFKRNRQLNPLTER